MECACAIRMKGMGRACCSSMAGHWTWTCGTLREDESQALRSFREQWRRHPLMRLQDATQRHRPLLDRMIDRYPGHDLKPRATTDTLPVDERALQSLRTPVLIIGGELDSQSR